MSQQTASPLIEHLVELRSRLIWSLVGIAIISGIFYGFKEEVFQFLIQPLKDAGIKKLIFTNVPELFFTYLKLSILSGLFVGMPVLLWHMWRFISPGLYDAEKKVFLPFLLFTPVLFYTGGLFSYFVVTPIAVDFFFQFSNETIEPLPSVKEYLSFLIKMLFGFGLAFELPLVLLLMARAGIVSAASLAKGRRYAIVGIFAAAAILTPPDPLSQLLLAVPMAVLYEAAVFGARLVEQKQQNDAPASGN